MDRAVERAEWDAEAYSEGLLAGKLLTLGAASRLRGIIQNVLDGNYPNPRDHRPSTCKHGTGYYDACEQCLDEYLSAALADEPSNG